MKRRGRDSNPRYRYRYTGFSKPNGDPRNDQDVKEIRDDDSNEVPGWVPSLEEVNGDADLPPDLRRLLRAWNDLPQAIHSAILMLVESSIVSKNL